MASRAVYEQWLDAGRRALSQDDFDRAWLAGEAFTGDEAIAFALESA